MSEVMLSSFKTAALPPIDLGSAYDPVLHGVAGGLADLFPPVHNPQRSEAPLQGEGIEESDEAVG